MNKILIIGKIPPPIGGVSTHVKRLTDSLESNKIEFKFISLNLFLLPKIFWNIFVHSQFHLHSSNLNFLSLITIWAKILKRRSIITIHGDLERFNAKNFTKALRIIRDSSIPILLNQNSLQKAKQYNKNAIQVSSFIPPIKGEPLNEKLVDVLQVFKKKHQLIYATNAYGFTFDKNGIEIYGIIDLIEVFKTHPNYGLVISDPSSSYLDWVSKSRINLPENILLISLSHSFFEILKLADASIRNTSTDGDSLSVKESLYLAKVTFATDIVSRPQGVVTYKRGNYESFFIPQKERIIFDIEKLDGSTELIELYTNKR